jgi:hypothetical protein
MIRKISQKTFLFRGFAVKMSFSIQVNLGRQRKHPLSPNRAVHEVGVVLALFSHKLWVWLWF